MVGFMQGRLVPMTDGKIQAFPWADWRKEFGRAKAAGFDLMEWTLDQERLHDNPLLTEDGRTEILRLCGTHGLRVGSLTGDCFMQAPFWKASDPETTAALQQDLAAIATSCSSVGIQILVVPLVDGGKLETDQEENILIDHLTEQLPLYRELGLRIAFESDFEPQRLAAFIARLDAELFGVNYDTGNSAALGFDPAEEWAAYGSRVINVHIKDRIRGGTTVPLGEGNADFDKAFAAMAKAGYSGRYILQTARAVDGDDVGEISRNRDFALERMRKAGLHV